MGIIRIGGIHGVGKSTLIEKALNLSDKKAPVIKGSEIMSEYLKKTPEQLPFISKEDRDDARKYMYEKLSTITYGIRDGHFCVYSEQGYEFPFDDREKDSVTAAVIIISSPLRVYFRRKKISRKRPLNIIKINEHQKYEIMAAERYSEKFGIPLYRVRNNNLDKAAAILSNILNEYLK